MLCVWTWLEQTVRLKTSLPAVLKKSFRCRFVNRSSQELRKRTSQNPSKGLDGFLLVHGRSCKERMTDVRMGQHIPNLSMGKIPRRYEP